MSTRDTTHPRWIGWVTLPVAFIAMGVSMYLGEMVFICLKYGQRAYFTEGLRFVKHKPYTLSNGVVFSQNEGSLVWLISIAIRLAMIIGTVAVLVSVSRLFRKIRLRSRAG